MAWINRGVFFGVALCVAPQVWAQLAPVQTSPAPAATVPVSTSALSPKPAPTPTPPAASSAPLSGVNLGEFDTTKPGQLKWENNPFVQTMESVGVQDMRLMAIVYRPGNAAALINGRIMKEGDSIGENLVVHIEAKRVVMRNADGIFSLTMSGAHK